MTKLNKKLLTAITAAIPKDNVRWYLNGLFIDYEHKRISATDGHCLVLIEGLSELENRTGARWVSRPAVTAFIRAQRPGLKEFDLASLEEFADREYNSFNAGRDTPENCAECAARYPDVMRVIPEDSEGDKKGRPEEFADREYNSFNAGRDTPENCAECAARYPDVMRVIPEDSEGDKKGRPAFFRWEYLKLIDDIEKALGVEWPDGAVYQLPERKSNPLKVVIEQFEGLKITVVIMPYKVCCVNAEV